jgi:uncharacterized protein (TIGR02302 family)
LRLRRSTPRSGGGAAANPRLQRLTAAAWAILFFERAWRIILPPLLVAGAFVSISWTGVWLVAPHWTRWLGVLALVVGLGAALLPLRRFRLPTRKEALLRIDQASGLASRPATVIADRLGNAANGPMTVAFWNLHRRRAEQAIALLRVGLPSPRAAELDPYGIRAVVLVALIATGFAAGPERYARVSAAFDFRFGTLGGIESRVDAWIDPPAYTGKTPTILISQSHRAAFAQDLKTITVPVGSIVVIHAPGGHHLGIEMKGGLAKSVKDDTRLNAKAGAPADPANAKDGAETRLVLSADATLTLRSSGSHLGTFDIHAILDNPPSIALTTAPKVNLRGSFVLKYRVADDYGVTAAEASFAKPTLPGGRPSTRSLVDPPRVSLALPPPPTASGEAETTIDLSDHPWAGASVEMTLTAHDEGGNEGSSPSTIITLPQKPFVKPLARALAEQRRTLILAPDDKTRVAGALDALMIAPQTFETSAGVYLGLRIALDRLNAAKGDSDLIDVADLLWQMALRIESGDLSAAERDLRSAEQELRDAMQRGAPEEEIGKLAANLRAAMDKFLQQLAAQEKNLDRQKDFAAVRHDGRLLRQRDLQRMIDDLQAMLSSGDTANAQRMLEQLQDILENLRLAKPRDPDPRAREMSRALDELGRLAEDQQDLRDETYASGQEERQQGFGRRDDMGLPPGLTLGDIFGQGYGESSGASDGGVDEGGQGKSGNPPARQSDAADLAKQQRALRDRVENLQKRLNEAGAGAAQLGEASDAMSDAGNALERGPHSNAAAVEAQGRAVDALREGAQKLADALQGQGDGTTAGEDEGQGSPGQLDAAGGTDPLGRPAGRYGGLNNPAARYDPLAAPAVERARRVLEELRRRLGEPGRPREELDYLQRLLRRY